MIRIRLLHLAVTAVVAVAAADRVHADDPFETVPQAAPDTTWWDAPLGPFCEQPVSGIGELEQLAVDIARRALLAHKPHAAKEPFHTVEVQVRPEGDVVHTYARLMVMEDDEDDRPFECEVFASLVYTRGCRRMFDISYRDNDCVPDRYHQRTAELLSAFNTEFERRDPLQMATPMVGPRMDVLAPRSRGWIWNLFQGDRVWHVFNADDRVRDGWIP